MPLQKKQIYLDNAATTPIDEKVVRAMQPYFKERYGNASSQHQKGREAKDALENARQIIAKSINCKSSEIYFTSGGTESNNWVIKGLFFKQQEFPEKKNHIITTKIEHDCILNSCKWLEKHGAKVTYLDVNNEGFLNLEQLKNSITNKTFLVSIIHGNNEIGVIQNLKEISDICHSKKVLLHTDACQSYTKTKLDVKSQGLDLVTLNAHKIHGPKGVGCLYIKSGIKISPLMHGGGHESGFRSGTENIPGIIGFAEAVKIANKENKKVIKKMQELQKYAIKEILKIPKTKINGPMSGDNRLCNNINICFSNIEGESIGGYLERENILISTGSACSSNTLEPSHVLKALDLSHIEINSSIRISINKFTTKEDIDKLLKVLPKIVNKLRKLSPFS